MVAGQCLVGGDANLRLRFAGREGTQRWLLANAWLAVILFCGAASLAAREHSERLLVGAWSAVILFFGAASLAARECSDGLLVSAW